ncbi:MAG: InlB B-repeat-containing protein [Paludibacteraceae bacterium]|nr:InlB B-repeat-containing protein [Paludibacteraceae bacterium]
MNQGVIDGASSGAGLIGGTASNSTISYCANTGNAKAQGISTNANVYCSYSTSKNGSVGISSGTVTNSYYINGSGNGTQKTDAQMKSVSMPILLNVDSTVFIQDVQPYVNKGYPIFKHGMKYIATNDASDVSYTSAQLNGNYYNCNPTSMGFEYKKSSASSYSSKTITNASPAQHILTGLTQGTTYDVRYWLVDNGIKYYGEVIQFTTLACPTKPVRSDTVTLCNGESYSFAGQTLTKAGIYRDSLVATTGCDSVIELVLKVYDTYKYPQFDTINRGESYDFYGQMLTEPGVYNEYIRTTNRCNWVQLNLYVIEPPKTLTLNVNNPQWGSVTGAGTYEHGEVVEFSAVPAAGCYLVNWSDGETNAVRAMALTKDTTITANFAIHQFTITTEAANGSLSGGGTYNYGTQVTLTATADEHYHFVHWNDGNTEATRQITVTEDKTYSAVFELDKFLVTFRNDDGTVLKSEEVEYGVMPIAPADPTKESTAQYDYTFAGWTPAIAIVTQAATYTATYTSALREYLVTFLNDDNTVISSKNYKYGETPVAPADPMKQNTAEYTYTFNGWDNAIAQVQGPQTYKATFTATKNSYTITWQNEDGSLIDQAAVEYGVVPTHAEPTKQATAEYTYTFAGWTPAVVAVTGNATYRATFNATKNKYLITFRDENGTILKSEEVEYGLMPVAPADPTKESTAQYDYTFAGWTPTVAIVSQAATYTAIYTSALREYLVTFLNEDNTVISSKNYKYGETPVAPADPVKQNTAEYTYTFNGWDNAIAQVQGPQTYKATFTATKNSYTITWQNEDGSLIDQTIVEYGQIPAHADPVKLNTAEYTYTFAGWTPTVVAVTGNATYKATFTATKNSYTITWQNEDGSLIDQTIVEYGQIPAHADPVKLNTAEYTYTFAGWTPAVVAVTGNATYKATFSATKNSYTITWQDENGSLIDQTTVEYGQIPAHADPVKLNTAEYTYTFAGWTPAVVAVTGNTTYKATFTATKNSYTITWQDENGSLIDQTTVEYGQIPAHADPVKLNTAEYTYTFAGWTPTVVAVTGNTTYKATFTATKNKYLITFRNDDGTVLKSEEVEYGMLPIVPATPTKESTVQYNYEFAGWTPTVTLVSQAATYTATYNSSVREYLVTFLNDDNSIISMQSCKYGSYPTIPSTPTKNATAEYSYTFAGWTPNIAAVSGDVTYKAMFTATKNSYTITWQDENGSLIDQTIVEYGQIPAHADPVKLNTAEYTYTFAGWTPAVVAVTGNATYRATFTAIKNTYTVTFVDYDGTELKVDIVEYGQAATPPANPVRENYYFMGWDSDFSFVTGDMTITATYKLYDPTSMDNIYTSEPASKVIIGQQIFILRGDKTYTLTGQEVK